MDNNEKYVLRTIEQYNENARGAFMREDAADFFEPLQMELPKRIPVFCAHCGKKTGADVLTLYCNKGLLTGAGDELPADSASVIATCTQCGSRIFLTPADVRAAMTRKGKTLRRVVILLVVLAVVLVGGLTIGRAKLAQQYYASAQEALQQNDYETAAVDLAKADRYGNADAAYLLGRCYENGTGVQADAARAEELLQKAEKNGSQLAVYDTAMTAFEDYIAKGDTQQLNTAVGLLQECTTPAAKYQLSILYRGGVGVTPDADKADALLQEATEAGDVDALCEMAYQQVKKQNASGALALLQQAPNQKDTRVMAAEGYANLFDSNVDAGTRQLSQASAQGSGLADFYWGEIYYNSMLTGTERDLEKARSYYQSAADKGCARGKVGLALCEMVAGDTEASSALAQECYSRGYAEAGAVLAMYTDDETKRMSYVNGAVAVGYSPAEIWRASYYADRGDATQCRTDLANAYAHGAMYEANLCANTYLDAGTDFLGPSLLQN